MSCSDARRTRAAQNACGLMAWIDTVSQTLSYSLSLSLSLSSSLSVSVSVSLSLSFPRVYISRPLSMGQARTESAPPPLVHWSVYPISMPASQVSAPDSTAEAVLRSCRRGREGSCWYLSPTPLPPSGLRAQGPEPVPMHAGTLGRCVPTG